MNGVAAGDAVEPLHGKRSASRGPGFFRQPFYLCHIDQAVGRHGDADAPRQLKHDELIFRDGGKAGRGKFDNPGPAHAAGRNGETA